jgi:hypothetical protein
MAHNAFQPTPKTMRLKPDVAHGLPLFSATDRKNNMSAVLGQSGSIKSEKDGVSMTLYTLQIFIISGPVTR